MPVAFGASIEGVRALLPHKTIGPTSRPTEAAVETYLEGGAGWVSARIGPGNTALLVADDPRTEWARSLVELYAGAFVEDAAFPERAAPGDTSYGGVLWERFLRGLDELLEALGEPVEPGGEGEEPGAVVGPLLYSFPAPVLITAPAVPPFVTPNTGPNSASRTV
jgi:hypothetical protein